MKSKIRLIIVVCFIAGVAVTGFNMSQNNQSTGVSLSDIAVMARADGENPPIPACVDVTYFPGNYTESETYSTCYNSDGKACGKQRTCEADPQGYGCNETMCQDDTSGK